MVKKEKRIGKIIGVGYCIYPVHPEISFLPILIKTST